MANGQKSPTNNVRIADGRAGQASGGERWVDLHLEPPPDARWRELFAANLGGLAGVHLAERDPIVRVSYTTKQALDDRCGAVDGVVSMTNLAYDLDLSEAAGRGVPSDDEVNELLARKFGRGR